MPVSLRLFPKACIIPSWQMNPIIERKAGVWDDKGHASHCREQILENVEANA